MFLRIVTVLVLLLLTRVYIVLSKGSSKSRKRRDGETCVLAVFLGSGGHTSEVLTLTSGLDFSRYSPRIYIVSEGDTLSASKAMSLEHSKAFGRSRPIPEPEYQSNYRILTIPRARRVHQSIWTVLPTFTRSLVGCLYLISIAPLFENDSPRAPFADLLILNGPGTCVTLCVAVMVNKLLGLPHPKMIYVESYARVRSLSLSGKILRYCVDRFVVQWPTLLSGSGREECFGCLV